MKFSILASFGTCPSASLCSQYLFALPFPHLIIDAICSSVQESKSTDLTREMCTPKLRCTPEQRMQTNTPMFQEAHRGCLLRLQSAHDLLDSSLTSCLSVARFCSLLSGPTGRRDMFGWGEGVGLSEVDASAECELICRAVVPCRVPDYPAASASRSLSLKGEVAQ